MMVIIYLLAPASPAHLCPVISSPMDMQTMLKRVKQKHYKSKHEFKDDLDLIWNNCFTYNAAEVRVYLVDLGTTPTRHG